MIDRFSIDTLLPGYTQWCRLGKVIESATASCETSGNNPNNHFAGTGKMVDLGQPLEGTMHQQKIGGRTLYGSYF